MKKAFISGIYIFLLLSACRPIDPESNTSTEVLEPIYTTQIATAKQVKSETVRHTVNPGKIYALGNIAFQVEKDSGIHVIDYANPSAPRKIGFIKSLLCKELSIKDGRLYTNNFSDLVVIDISSINAVKEIARVPNVFPDLALQYPPKPDRFTTVFFECPDPSKGIIIGWQKSSAKTAKCWR